MTQQGYIKLHRQIIEWEWYKNIPVRVLFEHCLLKANHKDNKWQGKLIKKGSFITSLDNLAQETGLSKMQIRTALKKLKLTHEITHETTHSYSIITVNNWDNFQIDNTQNNTQITHEQHTDNTPITLNNNDNNDKNEKEISILCFLNQVAKRQFKTSTKTYLAKISKWLKEYTVDELKTMIEYKTKEWLDDKHFCKYLTPDTLFSNKLPTYVEASKTYKQNSVELNVSRVKQIEEERRKKYGW